MYYLAEVEDKPAEVVDKEVDAAVDRQKKVGDQGE